MKKGRAMVAGMKTRAAVSFVAGSKPGQIMATLHPLSGEYIETKFFDSAMELASKLSYLLKALDLDVPDLPTLADLERGVDHANRKMAASRKATMAMIEADLDAKLRAAEKPEPSVKEQNAKRKRANRVAMDRWLRGQTAKMRGGS
jgi:hypothetical protein